MFALPGREPGLAAGAGPADAVAWGLVRGLGFLQGRVMPVTVIELGARRRGPVWVSVIFGDSPSSFLCMGLFV